MAQTTDDPSDDGSHDHEVVSNNERGCGYLKEGKAYLRGEVHPDGILPAFVEFTSPMPFLEGHMRGYAHFPGVQFELQNTPSHADYEVPVPPAVSETAVRDNPGAIDDLREQLPEGHWHTRTDPPLEVRRHLQRLTSDSKPPAHPGPPNAGSQRVARSHDLLMWVGETYYPTPGEFIEECQTQGLSKAIPVSSSQEPPVINPGRTRVFLVHPNAVRAGTKEDGEPRFQPGIIGYAYITRVVYTGVSTGDGEIDFPEWAREFADSDRMDLVRVGERVPKETQENGSTIGDWIEHANADDEGDVDPEDSEAPDAYFEDDADDDGYLASHADAEDRPDDEPRLTPAVTKLDPDGDDGSDDDDASTPDVREVLEKIPFQRLRERATDAGLDVGQNPSKDDVIDALIDADVPNMVGEVDG